MRFGLIDALRLSRRILPAAALALGLSGTAMADNDCSFKALMLRGTFVFTATGYSIVSGAAQPKAIVEVITFNGDGTLSVPAATVSLNGTIIRSPAGGTGTYTVDTSCTGTITFSAGQTFDTFVSLKGDKIWMLQTNPNNVFQGTAVKQ